jgi:hypothetical protein
MSEKIQTEVTFTAEELAEAVKMIRQRQLPEKFSLFYSPFAVVVLVLSLIIFVSPTLIYSSIFLIVAAVSIFFSTVVFNAAMFFLTRWLKNRPGPDVAKLKEKIDESPILQAPRLIIFDENGLTINSSLSESKFGWEAFLDVLETDKFFMFFYSNDGGKLVPKRGFATEGQNAIRELAKRKMGDRAKSLI